MFLAPEMFLGCAPPEFWTGIIKLGLVLTIVQNFMPVGPRISEISHWEKKNKTSGLKLKSAPQAIASGRTNKSVAVINNDKIRRYSILWRIVSHVHWSFTKNG